MNTGQDSEVDLENKAFTAAAKVCPWKAATAASIPRS